MEFMFLVVDKNGYMLLLDMLHQVLLNGYRIEEERFMDRMGCFLQGIGFTGCEYKVEFMETEDVGAILEIYAHDDCADIAHLLSELEMSLSFPPRNDL